MNNHFCEVNPVQVWILTIPANYFIDNLTFEFLGQVLRDSQEYVLGVLICISSTPSKYPPQLKSLESCIESFNNTE